MAADNSAVAVATQTLVAATGYKVNLTGRVGGSIELAHHGNVTNPVYFQVASTEALLTAFAAADDEIQVLLSGERMIAAAPRAGCWVRLLSAGTATVTVIGNR